MKDITKASRVNAALQVIQHMNDGMTVVEACRAIGMPPKLLETNECILNTFVT